MQNAGNDEFLEVVKRIANKKIYSQALKIYNSEPINKEGQIKAVEYLNQYFNWKEIEKYYLPHYLQILQ